MWIYAWFKNLVLKRSSGKKLEKAYTVMVTADPHGPGRKVCEELLHHLSVPQFALYQASAGQGSFIVPHCINIEDYTTLLRETTRRIRKGKNALPEKLTRNSQSVSVDRFLTSSDGYYQDVEKAVGRFKIAAVDFCAIMAQSDTEESGYYEYNLRMLTKLFIDLRIVTGALIEVSLQN
jgi:hypothetical protein